MTTEDFLNCQKDRVNSFLDGYLLPETVKPESIHKAIRYSVFSGGKRFRAALCIAAYETFGETNDRVIPVASGIELIHTYSLIHDDLPCMDDDDLRRGKPTLHRAYGENIAVLAGDALNALAFNLVSFAGNSGLIQLLANAIGTEGMIGGQVADVESCRKPEISREDVLFIHNRKTAALIRASLDMGTTAAGASEEQLEIISKFGSFIGLAFQIVDDILDIESSSDVLGKDVGSDEQQDKATFPKVFGIGQSKDMAHDMIRNAQEALEQLDVDTDILKRLAQFVIERVY